MGLSDILKNAVVVNRKAAKTNDRNQKAFDKMIIMSYKEFRLLVGHQTSKNEYVQIDAIAWVWLPADLQLLPQLREILSQ